MKALPLKGRWGKVFVISGKRENNLMLKSLKALTLEEAKTILKS